MLRLISALVLLALVAGGCGGSARPQRSVHRGLPRALAATWEKQASAIASAAAAGDDCGAMHLAHVLRDQVVARKHEVPRRLRPALLTGVDRLAARTTCPPPPTVATRPEKTPKPPHRHDKHEGHGHHGHGGRGGKDK